VTSSRNLLDSLPAAWEILSQRPAGLMTDVDGTLSPIVEQPEMAGLHPEIPGLLRRLRSRLNLVAAISGRPVSQLVRMVGVDGIVYVGNHGLELGQGNKSTVAPEAEPFLPAIASTIDSIQKQIKLPGITVENKGASGTIHYRAALDPEEAREAILKLLADIPAARGLQLSEGRRVVNVLPPVEISKGTAVLRLVREKMLVGTIYLGDDVTDLDAFRALNALNRRAGHKKLLVAVLSPEVPLPLVEEADYHLENVAAVATFLREAAAFLERSGNRC
jgi:trehalose 6-phosphate phosphatase